MEEKPIKILLIEDNPGDVRLIQEMLKEAGAIKFELVHADRLSSGQACLQEKRFDVLLLDIGLPDSQGLQALTKILAQSPDMPIVVLTGLDDEMVGVKAVHEGAQDYLMKNEVNSKSLARSIHYAIERKRMEDRLRKNHEQLEHLTIQLTAANKELEAFCYSVSHDLRAPLRSIDGFSKALTEDYADKLDEQGKNYLQRVNAASKRMGQLIDDLLNLSRITRNEMRRKIVDLSALVKTITTELRENQPERKAEFVIAEGLVTHGDPQLLRIALENLLSNALKFTRKCSHSRIEFGITQQNKKPAYYVRDNGVGFDMTYVNKLFGAFQRLHSTTDFEGTGIGLATVQRIIHRHGGQIWAEGAVEQGATFYFTLT